jgi:tetratricopeptide (TPR) repeat protein
LENGAHNRRWLGLAICVAIAAITAAAYAQVRRFQYVHWDDPSYPLNTHLLGGFSVEAVRWAFTSGEQANWHPLTWLSHLLDYQLFGARPGPDHVTALAIHILASLMLFVFLRRATGAQWRSGLVAFIFALHPLHVESVAWISERKDVLCAFFWFLTSWAWVRYGEKPAASRYALVIVSYCLALLSKPMAVTLPLTLLLLDFWPLRRPVSIRLLWEKLPLAGLAAADCVITYLAQHAAGATKPLSLYPLGLRVENALTTWMIYIGKMFWPTHLPFFYPYPKSIPIWQAVLAGAAIAALTTLAIWLARRAPWFTVGWLWYFVTLIPVIGLVQVGNQARADRYMYIPMVGLTIAIAWGAADAISRWPRLKPWTVTALATACAALVPVTQMEASYWESNESLLAHAILVSDNDFIAYRDRDVELRLANTPERQAGANFDAQLGATPNTSRGHQERGEILWQAGRKEEAMAEYRTAIQLNESNADAHASLGAALADRSDMPGAISEYDKALSTEPDNARALFNRGVALSLEGRIDEAVESYRHALRIDPGDARTRNNLGAALGKQGKWGEAATAFAAALSMRPDYADAQRNLGEALMKTGRLHDAVAALRKAVELSPDDAPTHNMLGYAMVNAEFLTNRYGEHSPSIIQGAIAEMREAVRLDPGLASAQENLARLLARDPASIPEAIEHIEIAIRLQPTPARQQFLRTLQAPRTGR